jgi:hypothetical protein
MRAPYSLGWTLQLDRELVRGVVARVGYERRKVDREFYVNPWQAPNGAAQLQLLNNGTQSYREFLANGAMAVRGALVHNRQLRALTGVRRAE